MPFWQTIGIIMQNFKFSQNTNINRGFQKKMQLKIKEPPCLEALIIVDVLNQQGPYQTHSAAIYETSKCRHCQKKSSILLSIYHNKQILLGKIFYFCLPENYCNETITHLPLELVVK